MVTYRELYKKGKDELTRAGIESPAFDCLLLMEFLFGLRDRGELVMRYDETVDDRLQERFSDLIRQRKNRPLQYILGNCDFMGYELLVGEGVLIPREDTAVLVNTAVKLVTDIDKPKVLDLCAGSGAISIALAGLAPNTEITSVEKYSDAYGFLLKNVEMYYGGRIHCLQLDCYDGYKNFSDNYFDIIVSNPPYIKTSEIEYLDSDVKKEPHEALNGGSDGLGFYRLFADKWISKLKKGGFLVTEVGIGQSGEVAAIFKVSGLTNINTVKDFQNIDRVIYGKK